MIDQLAKLPQAVNPINNLTKLTSLSYHSFIYQLLEQYQQLTESGYTFEFTEREPYETAYELRNSWQSKHIRIFSGGDMDETHPLSEITKYGVSANLIFRAVHDSFGHMGYMDNGIYDFSTNGEIQAYFRHMKTIQGLGRLALTNETVLQTLWVESNNPDLITLSIENIVFAAQTVNADFCPVINDLIVNWK